MTFSVVPFALQNAAHSAAVFRQAMSSLVPPGGGVVSAGDLAVTQTGTPSMNVSIGVGRIWIPGTNVGNVAGGNFSSQAMYYGQNDSAYTASVTTSDPINPRIDVVYAAIEDSQYAGLTNLGKLAVVAGVPTSGASYPANAPAIPANAKAIAWVNVPANASSIVTANITQIAYLGVLSGRPEGMIAHLSDPTISTGLAGTGIMCNLVNVNLVAGRRYRAVYRLAARSTEASLGVLTSFRTSATGDTTTAGTVIPYDTTIYTAARINSWGGHRVEVVWQAATTTTVALKVVLARLVGADAYDISDRVLYVEDLGAKF